MFKLLCALFFLLLGGSRCFVLMSSGVRETEVFEAGGLWRYRFHSTVLLNEKDGVVAKDVGFHIEGDVSVGAVWGGEDHDRLLRVELSEPTLHIRSRKVPTPEGFVQHTSLLESLPNKPFYLVWHKGRVEKVLFDENEPVSIGNLKKGIASLLQFQLLDQQLEELDASGLCKTTYTSTSPTSITKTKEDCKSTDLQLVRNPKPLLDTSVHSERSTTYDFTSDRINTITSTERHVASAAAKEEIGNQVDTRQTLNLVEVKTVTVLQAGSLSEAIELVGPVVEQSLLTEVERVVYDDVKSFVDVVAANREALRDSLLGTAPSAKVFLKLVGVARRASKEDVAKTLSAKANKNILYQIYDILGYAQTSNSHSAVMRRLHFDDENQLDASERYLWALSVSSQPNPEIIIDLLNKYKKTQNIPEQVKETLIMSIASMTHHLNQLPERRDRKVSDEVESTILNYLSASTEEARYPFLRALRNLRSPATVPTLLDLIRNSTKKEGVLSWKVIRALQPNQITPEVLNAATSTFFQLDKHHDSSSRTLALDIILESKPSDETLRGVIYYLLSADSSFEVKQYAIQSLRMLGEKDEGFRRRVVRIIEADPKVNNYATLGQKGLSVALARQFLGGESSNGSLLTVQEMHGGVVKRGIVNVVMDKEGISQEIFSLGIFSGGLMSFFSSEEEEDETAMAGMELSVLGSQVRPFIFFSGKGELMGHVWSGTASERTTAFQALTMLQDHQQYLRLGNGFVAEIDHKGGASFDLSGQASLSLWNRNAQSLVEKSAGIVVLGMLRVDSTFVRSQAEFSMSIEPRLRLETDIDFSNKLKLCMKLTQPDSVFKHSVYKIERIPGSKHRLRKTKTKQIPVPGKSYALNRKNSDMCCAIEAS